MRALTSGQDPDALKYMLFDEVVYPKIARKVSFSLPSVFLCLPPGRVTGLMTRKAS
jgi:hypothetical protein